MSFLSERTQPVLVSNTVAGTSYTQTSGSSVDLRTYQADSIMFVAVVNATTLTGFTMTVQGGDSTTALGGYCVTPGSTTTLMTVSSTAPAKVVYADCKNVKHRYVGVKHTGLAASNVTILGFPYDSKLQSVPLSADLSSTVVGTGWYAVVNPTTA